MFLNPGSSTEIMTEKSLLGTDRRTLHVIVFVQDRLVKVVINSIQEKKINVLLHISYTAAMSMSYTCVHCIYLSSFRRRPTG